MNRNSRNSRAVSPYAPVAIEPPAGSHGGGRSLGRSNAMSPIRSSRAASPRRSSRAASPRRSSRAASPRRSSRAASPRRSSRAASPYAPVAIEPPAGSHGGGRSLGRSNAIRSSR